MHLYLYNTRLQKQSLHNPGGFFCVCLNRLAAGGLFAAAMQHLFWYSVCNQMWASAIVYNKMLFVCVVDPMTPCLLNTTSADWFTHNGSSWFVRYPFDDVNTDSMVNVLLNKLWRLTSNSTLNIYIYIFFTISQ